MRGSWMEGRGLGSDTELAGGLSDLLSIWSICFLQTRPSLSFTWYERGPVFFSTIAGIHFPKLEA